MLKLSFAFVVSLFMTTGLYAQFEIHYEGLEVVSPSNEVEGFTEGSVVYIEYYIVNISDDEERFKWVRRELIAQNCIEEQIVTSFGAYLPYDEEEYFYGPEPIPVGAGDSISFRIGVSSIDNCCALNRYYLTSETEGVFEDSIDVKFRMGDVNCFLSLEEEQIGVSFYPNPVVNVLNVKASANAGDLKILNALGMTVCSFKFSPGVNQFDMAELPNGMYYCLIMQDGILVETEKIIIRH